jgi:hypothetical protein
MIGVNEFIAKWDSGVEHDRQAMCDMGWYDWFCTDKGLYSRLKKMVPAIRRIAKSEKVDDTMFIFFKNNCPCWVDETYDDFRICDVGTGDVLYCVTPRYPAIKPGTPKKSWCYARSDIGYVSTVWDFVADDDTKDAYHIENLAQGKPVDNLEEVVHGTRKEMYAYFGV